VNQEDRGKEQIKFLITMPGFSAVFLVHAGEKEYEKEKDP